VTSGVTCLDHADVHGSVTVSGGASLVVDGGSIRGSLTGSGAGVISMWDADLRGAVTFDATSQWLRLAASRVVGRLTVDRSAGPVAPDLTDSSVKGALSCAGNATPPVLTGTTVTGARSGQCATP
jgi:hypothetical protein